MIRHLEALGIGLGLLLLALAIAASPIMLRAIFDRLDTWHHWRGASRVDTPDAWPDGQPDIAPMEPGRGYGPDPQP